MSSPISKSRTAGAREPKSRTGKFDVNRRRLMVGAAGLTFGVAFGVPSASVTAHRSKSKGEALNNACAPGKSRGMPTTP